MHPRLRRTGPILSIAAAGLLCGAAPAPEGTEVTGGLGGGQYVRRGCGGQRYTIAEGAVYAQVRGRVGEHGAWAAEAAAGAGMVTDADAGSEDDSTLELEPGDVVPATFYAARIGLDVEHAGFSIGPGLGVGDSLAEASLVPSATAWVGKRDVLYGWAGLFEGPLTGANANDFARFGLGRIGERWSLEAGSNTSLGVSASGSLRVREHLWLGADLYADTPWQETREGLRLMGTLSFRP